jgi:hypothetical protein
MSWWYNKVEIVLSLYELEFELRDVRKVNIVSGKNKMVIHCYQYLYSFRVNSFHTKINLKIRIDVLLCNPFGEEFPLGFN